MRFEYLEPKTLEEATFLLNKYDGKSRIVAGGTDLVVQIRNKAIKPEYVVDIGYIPGLDYIKYDDKKGLTIGALTTIRSLEKSAEIKRNHPLIAEAASQLASVGIRNIATLGGNICNAAPSADTVPALIGLSAQAGIVGPNGERVVSLEDFFTGPGQTALNKGELLVEIRVPPMTPNMKGVYLKHSIRGTIDLAIVGVAVVLTLEPKRICKDIKIVLGAVAPTPMRAKKAEEIIRGRNIDDALIEESAQVASEESRPISDVRASAEYRKEMVKVFTRYALKETIAR